MEGEYDWFVCFCCFGWCGLNDLGGSDGLWGYDGWCGLGGLGESGGVGGYDGLCGSGGLGG